MSNINYQELRLKAELATCGAWSLEYGEDSFDSDNALIMRESEGYLPICKIEGAHPESGFDEAFQNEQQNNAEFIASANPSTVLALLDELEAAEKRIAELEAREVKLPDVEKWRSPEAVRAQNAYRVLVGKELSAAGIITKVGE